MPTSLILVQPAMPSKPFYDAREQSVRVTPDVDPFLTLTPMPLDGPTDASIHRAKLAQRQERDAAIAAHLETEGEDLTKQQLIDSLATDQVMRAMPTDIAVLDRRDAAAIAVRLHDPRWQVVSRYESATALLSELRNFMTDHGYASETELRELADRLASTAHLARYRVWTGQTVVTARTWCKAALGFLSVREER